MEPTYNQLIDATTLDYLDSIKNSSISETTVESELLSSTNHAIATYNLGPEDPKAKPGASLKDRYPNQKSHDSRFKKLKTLEPIQIAMCITVLYNARRICWLGLNDDQNYTIGIYQTEGNNCGIYDTRTDTLKELIRKFDSTISMKGVGEVIAILESIAPKKVRCSNRDYIPVNNGIFDYKNKVLMDFNHEYIFTSKSHVDYVEIVQNPIITMPDGETWDIESWMSALSDDSAIVELLWQVVGSVIRPTVRFNKVVLLYSTIGNNGKGTLCQFMRNICGSGSYTSIPIKDFGKEYMLKPLTYVSAVIVDENDTGTFLNSADTFKAAITHDVIRANIKFQEPKDIRFNGMMIQCVNEIPKFSDKSESLYRRILPVPMDKSFKGIERKYIKDEYLARKDVLEYALHKVLNMSYYTLNEPQSCLELLSEVKQFNDPVRQFLDDVLPEFSWSLIANEHLYRFYQEWFKKNVPSGKLISKSAFLKEVRNLMDDDTYPDWEITKSPIQIKGRMDYPEPLIKSYNINELTNSLYPGTDITKFACPFSNVSSDTKYRGIVKKSAI